MKKIIILLGVLYFVLIGYLLIYSPYKKSLPAIHTIEGSILINRLHEDQLNLTLLYSDYNHIQIYPYQLTPNHINPLSTVYKDYTEGYIEDTLNTRLLEVVNLYRSLENLEPITHYFNYLQVGNYGFLSLTEGLHTLYIIDLTSFEVTRPSFDSQYALEKQYVYQITEGDDAFYVLTAKANSHDAYWYALDKNDFHLLKTKQLSPPHKAVQRNQYALDSNGNAYFVGVNNLLVVTVDGALHLPLNFDPELLYYTEEKLYIFSTSERFLTYACYCEDMGIIDYGQVNLPNQFVSLVNLEIKDSILYTATYDEAHPLYRNYITIYHLEDHHMLYCLALRPSPIRGLSLQDVHYKKIK